ncbi:MAG: PqqD family protein [Clostridia bacterium]|nr:PqqD family protein [Clostridia bacterium]MBR6618829.1 PqqD family protein [Clostridia bacterium]
MYRVKEGFIIRKIGGYVMAVPTGTQTSEMHGMIALNETGELLWKLLEKGADADVLANALAEHYEVEKSVALNDVIRFIDMLKEQGALQ